MSSIPRGTRRTRCALLGAALACSAALAPARLLAQGTQANGIKVGEDARLHFQADLDSRYSTNPGRISTDDPTNEPTPDMVLAIRPAADLDMAGTLLELKAKAHVEYQRYLGIQNDETKALSTFFYEGALESVVNKNGSLTLRITDNLRRSADPGQSVTDRLEHTSNEIMLDLESKPGGGALVFNLGYSFFYDYYDREGGGFKAEVLDNMRHTPRLRAAWKFLPKTAVFIEGSPSWTLYPSDEAVDAAGTLRNEDTMILSAAAGATGAITAKISAMLKAGYGASFTSGNDFGSVIGMAELRYGFSETQKAMLGYNRSVQPTSLFRYVATDCISASFNQQIAGRLQVSANLGYSLLTFGRVTGACTNTSARSDRALSGTLGLDVQLSEVVVLSISDTYEQRTSNCETLALGNAGYTANETFLRGSFRY